MAMPVKTRMMASQAAGCHWAGINDLPDFGAEVGGADLACFRAGFFFFWAMSENRQIPIRESKAKVIVVSGIDVLDQLCVQGDLAGMV